MILRERPLFVIRKQYTEIMDSDILTAFQQLLPGQKQQFLRLRDNGSTRIPSMKQAFRENSFQLANSDIPRPQPIGPPVHGLFLLQSRFNHSCIPNSKIPTPSGEVIARFATRCIVAGEEITFCYNTDFECRTRQERHRALGFACDCKACLPGTTFQQLSDMRRRLIRGLHYLTQGVNLEGQKDSSDSAIIIDPELKEAAEAMCIPISYRLVYGLLIIFLLEEEGLLDDIMLERLRPGILTVVTLFKTRSNARVSRLAMRRKSWRERLHMAFKLYGRGDVADFELAMALRKLRGVV